MDFISVLKKGVYVKAFLQCNNPYKLLTILLFIMEKRLRVEVIMAEDEKKLEKKLTTFARNSSDVDIVAATHAVAYSGSGKNMNQIHYYTIWYHEEVKS